MLRAALRHMNDLRAPIRAMLYLHWIYSFVGALTGMFVHIFLYQRFASVTLNVLAQAALFLGIVIGFSVLGAVVGAYRLNLKHGYVASFAVMCASFLLLFGDAGETQSLMFMFVNGLGQGLYWLTLHGFELTETRNDERDYYSSLLSVGDQVIDLLAPAIATLLFFISSDLFHLGSYTLLFMVAPVTFLVGLPFFRHIRIYRPSPIEWDDVKHFFRDKKNQLAHIYFFGGSANYAFSRVALPLAAIIFLGTEKNVGVFSTIFAAIAAFALLFLARRRHVGNRLKFLFVTSAFSAAILIMLAFRFDLLAFVAFSLLNILVKPLQRSAAHVIDLETMETSGREGRDFYATMVFRDAALGFWRIVSLGCFALLITFVGEGPSAVRLCLVLLALSSVLVYVGAVLLYRKYPRETRAISEISQVTS